MLSYDVIIVGAGHAGAQAAALLRQRGFRGSVAMFGAEPEHPYERPPLSKEYLSGDKPFDRLLIRTLAFWHDKQIDVVIDTEVAEVDSQGRRLTTADGRRIAYGSLIWAAGGEARRLECTGHDLNGVHAVRTRADVDRLIGELPRVERIVVIGGGFIGLEAAAVLTKLGKSVVLLEAQDRLLARVCGEEISRFFADQHRARGVELRLGTVVSHIVGRNGRASGVALEDGATISCDMVIAGIGIIPTVTPLIAAGATDHNGALVDKHGRTDLPAIYAIGDCARRPSRFSAASPVRLESVQNAHIMANAAVAHIVGDAPPAEPVPWFWSNQFDLRVQTAGLSTGYDQTVVRGDTNEARFSIIYLRDSRVIALDCVNAIKDFTAGKLLVDNQASIPLERLSDTSIALKED